MPKRIEYTEEQSRQLRTQLDECLKYLDYKAIHKTMVTLDRHWFGYNGVPTLDQIKERADDIAIRAHSDGITNGYKDWFGGTGGFNYRIKYWKKDNIFTVDMWFAVTDWSNGYL